MKNKLRKALIGRKLTIGIWIQIGNPVSAGRSAQRAGINPYSIFSSRAPGLFRAFSL